MKATSSANVKVVPISKWTSDSWQVDMAPASKPRSVMQKVSQAGARTTFNVRARGIWIDEAIPLHSDSNPI